MTPFDFDARLKRRLWTLAKQLPNWTLLVEFIAEQLAEADLQAVNMASQTALGSASTVGEQLNRWGRVLNQPRLGLSDADYHRILLIRIAALFRRRTLELFYDVLEQLDDGSPTTYDVTEYQPAAVAIGLYDIAAADASFWFDLLRRIKPEGVRLDVIVSEATAFRYDTPGEGYDQGRQYSYTLTT